MGHPLVKAGVAQSKDAWGLRKARRCLRCVYWLERSLTLRELIKILAEQRLEREGKVVVAMGSFLSSSCREDHGRLGMASKDSTQ